LLVIPDDPLWRIDPESRSYLRRDSGFAASPRPGM